MDCGISSSLSSLERSTQTWREVGGRLGWVSGVCFEASLNVEGDMGRSFGGVTNGAKCDGREASIKETISEAFRMPSSSYHKMSY